jgi:hypothetical protein
VLIWVTGHCNRAAVSRNRYGVEKTNMMMAIPESGYTDDIRYIHFFSVFKEPLFFFVFECTNLIKKNCWDVLIWVTGHCNRAAVSRNRYGVEKTVDTHKILINAIKFYVCLQEIWWAPLQSLGFFVFFWFHHVFPILSVILTKYHYLILTDYLVIQFHRYIS